LTNLYLPKEIDIGILSETELILLNTLWGLFLNYPGPDKQRVRFVKALVFSYKQHTKTHRKSGETYFIHDLRLTVQALLSGADLSVAIIMLSHEFKEDDAWTYHRLAMNFGKEIAIIVCAASKPPATFATREERLDAYLDQMRQAMAKDGSWWKILFEKLFDRHDNVHDTAGLNARTKRILFTETEQKLLPFFHEHLSLIPPSLLKYCQRAIFEIEYACANYRQSLVCKKRKSQRLARLT